MERREEATQSEELNVHVTWGESKKETEDDDNRDEEENMQERESAEEGE